MQPQIEEVMVAKKKGFCLVLVFFFFFNLHPLTRNHKASYTYRSTENVKVTTIRLNGQASMKCEVFHIHGFGRQLVYPTTH